MSDEVDHQKDPHWRNNLSSLPRGLPAIVLLLICVVTAERFWWELQHFRSPGVLFFRIAIVGVVALFLTTLYCGFKLQLLIWKDFPRLEISAAGLVIVVLLLYEPLAFLVVAALCLSCYALGLELISKLNLRLDSTLEMALLSTGLGLGLLTIALFFIGLPGGYYPVVFVVVFSAFLAVGRFHIFRIVAALHKGWRSWVFQAAPLEPMAKLGSIFAAIFILIALPVILVPSLAFDVLRYHLPAVRLYSLGHKLVPVPFSDYSYYPQGVEVLMTAAYSLGKQAAAQMVTPAISLLSILAIYRILRNCEYAHGAALTGVVCAFSIPFVHWSGAVAKNDSALSMYQSLSLLCVLRWQRTRSSVWILLGAFFLGCSFGVKQVALFGAIPLAAFFFYGAAADKRWVRTTVLLLVVILLSGTLWQTRTFLLTGNPVYPEGVGLAVNATFAEHHDTPIGVLKRYLTLPWRTLWEARDSFESPLKNPSGIVLLVLGPVWLFMRRRAPNRAEQICLLFCLIYLAYWGTVLTVIRYAILPVCILAGLSGARLFELSARSTGVSKVALCSVLVYCEIFALCGVIIVEWNVPQFRFLAHLTDKNGYLTEALATYPSVHMLEGVVKPGDRVFGINNCSAMYAPAAAQFDCVLEPSHEPGKLLALSNRILKQQYRFVIMKPGPEQTFIAERLQGRFAMVPILINPDFSVYRIEES